MTMIKAPWTDEQVDALNTFQTADYIHPFTCPNIHTTPCTCIREGKADKRCHLCFGAGAIMIEDRRLRATPAGWICPHCDYTQDWAHDFMLETWIGPPDWTCPKCDWREMADKLRAGQADGTLPMQTHVPIPLRCPRCKHPQEKS